MAGRLPNNPSSTLKVFKSCHLTKNFQVKIDSMDGERQRPTYMELYHDPLLVVSGAYQEGLADLRIDCQVFENGKPLLLPEPMSTSYKAFTTRWNWNEWLNLPIKISELPRHAVLTFTILDAYYPLNEMVVGSTAISVFEENGLLRQGFYELKVWPKVEADGKWNSSTPGLPSTNSKRLNQLKKGLKEFHSGDLQKCEWLDKHAVPVAENINHSTKKNSKTLLLNIEFPKITYQKEIINVIYYEEEAPNCPNCQDFKDANKVLAMALGRAKPTRRPTNHDTCPIFDPDIRKENPMEKHRTLERQNESSIKPNVEDRNALNAIMNYPIGRVHNETEDELLWKYRFYLISNKKALLKFFWSFKWRSHAMVKEALELLKKWEPIDPEDALELLSRHYLNYHVRRYAVSRLQEVSDEDLMLYLLQLVQALKYEGSPTLTNVLDSSTESDLSSNSSLEESSDSTMDSSASTVEEADSPQLFACDLATFLINRACANSHLANYLYWYLEVEKDAPGNISDSERQHVKMYYQMQRRLLDALEEASPESTNRKMELVKQKDLLAELTRIYEAMSEENGSRFKKIRKLQELLRTRNMEEFDAIPFPLDPSVKICGIRWDKASLFKSSQLPCLLHFMTTEDDEYMTIFKIGDDLRQDQLILKTISLMDKILKKEDLNLELTPYLVLPTSRNTGFVQFVKNSAPVAEILKRDKEILKFLHRHALDQFAPYRVRRDVMENYVRSVAGYCVITYVLGVGDRHLENILLTKSGRLFHIDFGFILGREPKPYVSPIKLTLEMVEAMGGPNSEHFNKCKQLCISAFLQLRRHSNVILSTFALMLDSGIQDIAKDPETVLNKVHERLMLDYSDDIAVKTLMDILNKSMTRFMDNVVEQAHSLFQNLRI